MILMRNQNIAIIPARSGSKGLKNKNIMQFNGKPMLAWTIEAALKSGVFDKVMVSTDSEEYAAIAVKYGAEVPFLRKAETASDTAGSWDVVREVLGTYEKEYGVTYETCCLLQPTSPLRTTEDIVGAYDLYEKKNARGVVAVCELEHSIKTCNSIPENGCLNGFFDSTVSGRRQDGETFYRINGAIYIQKAEDVINGINLYGNDSYAYVMSKQNSVDIDDETDFICAEAIAKKARD